MVLVLGIAGLLAASIGSATTPDVDRLTDEILRRAAEPATPIQVRPEDAPPAQDSPAPAGQDHPEAPASPTDQTPDEGSEPPAGATPTEATQPPPDVEPEPPGAIAPAPPAPPAPAPSPTPTCRDEVVQDEYGLDVTITECD